MSIAGTLLYSCNFAIQIIRLANLIRILHPVVLKPYKFFCCLDTTWIQIIMHSDSTKPSNKDMYELHLSEFGMIFSSFFMLFANSCKHTITMLILLLHFIIFHSFSMKHMYEWVLVNRNSFCFMNTYTHGCIFITFFDYWFYTSVELLYWFTKIWPPITKKNKVSQNLISWPK